MTDSDSGAVDPLVTTGTHKVTKGARLPKPEPENTPAEPSAESDPVAPTEPVASADVTVVDPAVNLDALQAAIKSLRVGKEFSARLYSALQASNIRSYQDAKKRPMAVVAALNTAHNLDAMRIIDALQEATSGSS